MKSVEAFADIYSNVKEEKASVVITALLNVREKIA